MFFWKKPPPRFRVGDLLLRLEEKRKGNRYMVVQNVRWVKPNYEPKKQWVYDGILIDSFEGEITVSTGVSCVCEDNLHRVIWHENNRHLLDPRLLYAEAA